MVVINIIKRFSDKKVSLKTHVINDSLVFYDIKMLINKFHYYCFISRYIIRNKRHYFLLFCLFALNAYCVPRFLEKILGKAI